MPLPAATQFSSALRCLHLVIVEKGVATDELHANNQELEAVLEGLLNVRGELRSVDAGNGPSVVSTPRKPLPNPKNLDFPQLKQQADLILKKAQAVVQESVRLRMRSKNVRAALVVPIDGHSNVDGHFPVDGHAKLPRPEFDTLSKRERQVLTLIVAGKSSKEIAAELGISFKTTVTHRSSIMSKMAVHEIASVVREAIRRGLA